MKYFLYNPTSGDVMHFGYSPDNITESFVAGLEIISAEEYGESDMASLRVINGELTRVAPKEFCATPGDIKSMWQFLEQSPIEASGIYIDFDPLSELRMRNTIEMWDVLPIISGQFEAIDGVKMVTWNAVEGKITLSREQLTDLFDELLELRAKRAAILFSEYQRIKSITNVTLSYVKNISNWAM